MMNASPAALAASSLPVPLSLSPPEAPVAIDGLFGWFTPGVSRRGVVLCGTLGYEQLSAHRAWRSLAGRLAAAGCATLRFDYPGEGDSGDEGAGRAEALVASIGRAVRFLREEAGAEEIVLVGLRLGGLLAAAAADGVDRVALLAPFPSGRAYLREMRLQAGTIGRLPDETPLPQAPGLLVVGGFGLGPDLCAGLSGLDLAALPRPAPRILLVGEPPGLAARYRAAGAAVTAAPFPGLARLVANPLFAAVPEAAFSAVVDFAAEGLVPRPSPHRDLPPARIAGPGWREEPARFGAGLVGILCRPEAAETPAPRVLFVNAGLSVRSGWGRHTTRLARRLAAAGFPSLRIDVAGIGDSPDRAGGASPLYSLDPLDDVRAALDRLGETGAGPTVIVGSCSGAYLAFQAVCRERRLAGALLVNPYCFDWTTDDTVESVLRRSVRSPAAYASLIRRGATWGRLLRGDVRVAAIMASFARRAGDRARRGLGRLVRPAPGGTVADRIAALRGRGGRLRLLYSAGDVGLADLRAQLGRSPERVLGEPVTVLDGVDHDLSLGAAQERLAASLLDLVRGLGSQGAPGTATDPARAAGSSPSTGGAWWSRHGRRGEPPRGWSPTVSLGR